MTTHPHLLRYFQLWKDGDSKAISALYAPEAQMLDPTLPEPRTGREEIERYYAEMWHGLANPTHDLLDWASRGDRIWFEWTFGDERAKFHGVSIQTLRHDGLIISDDAFWNPA
jgi:hypothetical protein